MRARAPGKLILSGAYSVLEGAPAIVTTVNRYVLADAARVSRVSCPEVIAALDSRPGEHHPWFDARALRSGGQKLGLGSSAAIVVACLAALELRASGPRTDELLRRAIAAHAFAAHAQVHLGGSGIDVAASLYGGTLIATLRGRDLDVQAVQFPADLHVDVWNSGHAVSTRDQVARVRALSERAPQVARRLLEAQGRAARDAAQAWCSGMTPQVLVHLSRQCDALDALGVAAGAPIVTTAVRQLNDLARAEGGVVLPSGAGGGDVVVYCGTCAPSTRLLAAAEQRGHQRLQGVAFGVCGVHAVDGSGAPLVPD